MGEKEYQEFRANNFKKGLVQVNRELKKYEQLEASTSGSLQVDKNQLSYLKNRVAQSTSDRDSQYKRCLADGKYTLVYCKNLLSHWEDLTSANQQILDLDKKVASDQGKLKEYEQYQTFYSALVKSLGLIKGTVSNELGVFLPPNSIKIAFSASNTHAAADYFETLVHEYLHYASYVSENKKLSDVFFE